MGKEAVYRNQDRVQSIASSHYGSVQSTTAGFWLPLQLNSAIDTEIRGHSPFHGRSWDGWGGLLQGLQ